LQTNRASTVDDDDIPGVLQGNDLETVVLRLVKEDPFMTISELKGEIAQRYESVKAGWWRIFSILKHHHLLKRRARFRYARGRR
jgi:hypothetical protein